MMLYLEKLISLTTLLLAFGACNTAPKVERLVVDVDSAMPVYAAESDLVALESSDSALIYDINNLEILDGKAIVHSREYLKAYDAKTGRFLGNISRKGNSDNEFSYISRLWVDGDTLRVYDCNANAIISFLSDGTFLGRRRMFLEEERPGEKPYTFAFGPGGDIFTLNMFTDGTTDSNPTLSRYSVETHYKGAVKGRNLREGGHLPDALYFDNQDNRLLYWEPLRDTIFEIRENDIRPIYAVDFDEYSMSPEIRAKAFLNERLVAFEKGRYASLVRYVQRAGDTLYFSFADSGNNCYIALVDIPTGDVRVRHFASRDDHYAQSTFFKIFGDSMVIEMPDKLQPLNNAALYTLALSDL